ncbi:unnamed protein product [Brassica rapa]|uniref:DUF223 domain-containing protein n=1 Tax=Brassica campestris TaxID=3711 RepID=A0A3P5ZN12_BRACM|nr:unnamed protein product [Brassica rapa]VDC77815.1 unnamed protein product [Brassica rapa]
MLLIVENSTMVQGSVPALRQLKFRKRLTEGSIYTLSGFDVTRSNPKFRLSGAPFSLRFNDGTDFEKLKTTVRTIPTEQFRFRPYDQLLELANTGKQLPAKPNIHSPATDDIGTGAFLGFNAEVTKLTHVLASESAQIVLLHLPRSLADIAGNTYTFQLKLKDFNITPNHQTFTISRIFHARDLAAILTFAEGGEVNEPALLQNVSPGSEDIAAITSNVAEHSTAADGAIPGREAVAKEQVDLEENAIDTIQDFTYLSPPSFDSDSPSLISLPSTLQEVMVKTPVAVTGKAPSARSQRRQVVLYYPHHNHHLHQKEAGKRKKYIINASPETNGRLARQQRRSIHARRSCKAPSKTYNTTKTLSFLFKMRTLMLLT